MNALKFKNKTFTSDMPLNVQFEPKGLEFKKATGQKLCKWYHIISGFEDIDIYFVNNLLCLIIRMNESVCLNLQ